MPDAKTLLIVDDSKFTLQILRKRFIQHRPSWVIYESDNGADALEMMPVCKPDYVSLDVNMPNMSGLETAEKIRHRWPNARIVMVTANIQEATQKRARDLGCGFVEKPITDDSIPAATEFFEGLAKHV